MNPEELFSGAELSLVTSIENKISKGSPVPKEEIIKLIELTRAMKTSIGYYRDALFDER